METSPKATKKSSDSETTNNIFDHPKPESLIPSSYINNKHHQQHHQPTYKECLKNHASSLGGHALDGCGEFMPSTDSNSLKCVACNCHRNFHCQEFDEHHSLTPHFLTFHHQQLPPHMLVKMVPDEHKHHVVSTPMTPTTENVSSRKWFRTKFSQEQKDKMHLFSEKIGWRMYKSDEVMVEELCKEIGVRKSVLKIWMHNNMLDNL
ncbi:ZF-HD homeobox protein family [Heracleum sosnowskyi]|uniref:ZF-HD homeobox protein family n=1 Tax=Heracleum sosnowskyi TaxID=360622 RepID=A0AAD8I5N3_9APIA|nr:ZF-HD homeobox protein family [Heracleum sosnowskyi]